MGLCFGKLLKKEENTGQQYQSTIFYRKIPDGTSHIIDIRPGNSSILKLFDCFKWSSWYEETLPLSKKDFKKIIGHYFGLNCLTMDNRWRSTIRNVKKKGNDPALFFADPFFLTDFEKTNEDFYSLSRIPSYYLLLPIYLNEDECIIFYLKYEENKFSLIYADPNNAELSELCEQYNPLRNIMEFFKPVAISKISVNRLEENKFNTYMALSQCILFLNDAGAEHEGLGECLSILKKGKVRKIASHFNELNRILSTPSYENREAIAFGLFKEKNKKGSPEKEEGSGKRVSFSDNAAKEGADDFKGGIAGIFTVEEADIFEEEIVGTFDNGI